MLIYRGGGRRENRGVGGGRETTEGGEGEGGSQKGGNSTVTDRGCCGQKRPRTGRSASEMDTGWEASTSIEFISRCKKRHMLNIYLTDSHEEAILELVRDHEELSDKTSEHFKDTAWKECLWERFASSFKLSVNASKSWFESQRTRYEKLTQS